MLMGAAVVSYGFASVGEATLDFVKVFSNIVEQLCPDLEASRLMTPSEASHFAVHP